MKDIFKIALNHNRIFGLDLLRFMAISLVMLSHGRFFLASFLGDATEQATIGGFAGVELFFVLSGFLVGGIFIKICEKEGKLTLPVIWDFWKRRWFRTLPNYYLILLVSTFMALAKGKALFFDYPYYLYYIFCQNLFSKSAIKFFGESWSLTIEEWFYLTLPLNFAIILSVVKRIGFKIQLKHILFTGIVLLLLAGLFIRILFVMNSPKEWDYIRGVVFLRLDSIIWGVLFAWLNFYYKDFMIRYRHYFAVTGVVLIIHIIWNYKAAHVGPADFYLKTIYFTVTDFAFACLLPFANAVKNIRWGIVDKIVTTVSVISYSIYLTHVTFSLNLMLFLRKWQVPFIRDFQTSYLPGIFCFVTYLVISIVISILLYKYYEKPMTDLRDRKKLTTANY